MPPFPGEERLVTVFADIHYYFDQPTVRPVLHRFDKASYFYIYYNATRHSSRIEVANNAGTPDQDAFNGYVDRCSVINSYKFPTLLTLVVDGTANPGSPSSPISGRDPDEWRLSSGDLRNAGRAKYRIHTMDVYFWAQEDSRLVVECFKRLLHPSQLDIVEAEANPQPEPVRGTAFSPVVQNLENMAISDPTYAQHQRNPSVVSPTSFSGSQGRSPSLSVPPPPPPQGVQHVRSPSPVVSDISNMDSNRSEKAAQNFSPMAYNPAAPAAPEPIAHREKTPPPPDDGTGTGLSHVARNDGRYQPGGQPQSYQPGQPNQYGGYVSSPPPPPPGSAGYAAPPIQQTTSPYQDPRSSYGSNNAPSFGPNAVSIISQQDHRQSVAAETYTPHQTQSQAPVQTPGSQFYSSVSQPNRPLQHVQPQYADYLAAGVQSQHASPPPGGFAQFSYGQNQQPQQQQSQGNIYDVHNQVYRPTEEEANARLKKDSARRQSTKQNQGSKFDQGADKIEKKVGSLFKKLEKKIG